MSQQTDIDPSTLYLKTLAELIGLRIFFSLAALEFIERSNDNNREQLNDKALSDIIALPNLLLHTYRAKANQTSPYVYGCCIQYNTITMHADEGVDVPYLPDEAQQSMKQIIAMPDFEGLLAISCKDFTFFIPILTLGKSPAPLSLEQMQEIIESIRNEAKTVLRIRGGNPCLDTKLLRRAFARFNDQGAIQFKVFETKSN